MDIMKIVEEAKQAFEEAAEAEKELRRVKEKVHKARKRGQRAAQRFLSTYRKITGVSIRETQTAVEWMANIIYNEAMHGQKDDSLGYFKMHAKQMMDEAQDWKEMMRAINRIAYAVRKEVAFKNLANHREALEAAREMGYLTADDIATIMRYSGKEVD